MHEDAKHERFQGYAVFLYPQALEILGEAIRPYLHDGPHGPHVLCSAIDTGGALIEMTLQGRTADDQSVEIELMIPSNMVRMIVSARSDGAFGFGPRVPLAEAGAVSSLPPAPLASARTAQLPVEFANPTSDAVPSTTAKLPPEG
ncbi:MULTISPECIES: hypothetical protein [unclassified Lysobacter]|uniref:hypothetical protein n=1 Tax=unclassified Lysobacter TaxID=2635362 RepID=UPI001C239CAB|nr:hypothetical protein [Lysobacter sp. MMG2]MBU8975151.1 hypothetical protein [Lysobacter sp. MMG2]